MLHLHANAEKERILLFVYNSLQFGALFVKIERKSLWLNYELFTRILYHLSAKVSHLRITATPRNILLGKTFSILVQN